MTSPAIKKSPEEQKAEKKSPAHSAPEAEPTAGASDAPPQAEHFSWLRIFKLADLMMKQGC